MEFQPAEQLAITSLDALKASADPLRLRIVEILRRRAATVKEIAAELRVAPKSLYYHVNLLQKHGLIRVVDTRLVSGIVEKRYRATAYLFNFQDLVSTAGITGEQRQLAAAESIFDITREDMRMSAQNGLLDLAKEAPAERALRMDWRLLVLPPDKVAALNERFNALLDEYAPENSKQAEGRTYRLLLALFPTYQRSGPDNHGSAAARRDQAISAEEA